MTNLSRMRMWWIAVMSLWMSAALSFADGKMYVTEKIPTRIPYQRALILHDEGVQTMVLQSQYEIPGSGETKSLGWVVPVPAPPEVASIAADEAEYMFPMIDWRSGPKVTRISNIVYTTFILMGLIGVVGSLIWSLLPGTEKSKGRLRFASFCYLAGVFFIISPLFLAARAWKGGTAGVEIISAERRGIYEVQVVRSSDAGELVAWLNDNSFHFGEDDQAAIDDYLGRGWCFVVAKVDPRAEATDSAVVTKGLLAPLVLRFASPNPVYPVALTATGGHPTEILIYLASKTPMRTDSPLTLRYSGTSQTAAEVLMGREVDPPEFFHPVDKLLEFTHLTKFKATLSPAQMAKDIEFHPVPGAPDYREQIYRW